MQEFAQSFVNVHDHVGQIKGPGIRNQVVPGLSSDASGALRCIASSYATNTAVQSVAVLQVQPCVDGEVLSSSKDTAQGNNRHAAGFLC
eukprot:6213639-Pleurochrysis_carterae.AAC.5